MFVVIFLAITLVSYITEFGQELSNSIPKRNYAGRPTRWSLKGKEIKEDTS